MTYLYEELKAPVRLYIKQCPHCGLKYFGKTISQDIENYTGSGKRWKSHLKKHGIEPIHLWNSDWYYDTSITRFALRFSRMNKIVESDLWANLKEEDGIDGGWIHVNSSKEIAQKRSMNMKGEKNHFYGKKHSQEVKDILSEKSSIQWKGVPKTKEHRQKIAASNTGKVFSEERKRNISLATKGRTPHNKGKKAKKIVCEHCEREISGLSNFNRFHGEKCKQ